MASPFKTRYEAIGYMFGKPLEDFNHLLPVQPVESRAQSPKPSSSLSIKSPDKPSSLMEVTMDMDKILPTDLDIVCNWIFECDRTRTSRAFPEANSVIHQVTDNLIKFWTDQTSIVLRSREVIFNAIKRVTQKADKFSNFESVRKNDQEWIEKKLVEGKFRQVRDISQLPTPSKDATPLSPKRLESPVVLEDLGRGKRSRVLRTPCQNAGCSNEDCTETSNYHSHVQHPTSPIRRALFFDFDSEHSEEAIPDDGDPNYEVVDEEEEDEPKVPSLTMERVIALQARFNRSDAETALWWNMVSLDQGITDPERLTCTSSVTNANKKQEEKVISSHVQEHTGFPDIDFDGKKSETSVGKNRKKVTEHYTCTSGGKYLDIFSPPKPPPKEKGKPKVGMGKILAMELHIILQRYFAVMTLIFIGCDSTNVNSGWENGAIATLEHTYLGRALFWVLCFLHLLESPMKHLMEHWDEGPGNNDKVFTKGPIRNIIKDLQDNLKPFVEFEPFSDVVIPTPDPEILQNNDVRNFYHLGVMLISGVPNPKLLNILLPALHKARWYTYLIRLFRAFLQEPNPSVNFRKMVRFGLWHLHMTILVKMSPLVQDAPKLFHKAMVEANACLEEDDEKVKCVHFFQVSPYWAHSEAILLALLSDEDPEMRKWGVQKIIQLRQESTNEDGVRVWRKVNLLFNPIPNHYRDLIDWDKENITEPPPTKHISLEDLNKISSGEKHLAEFIPKVMSHSIANERCVQETAKKVLVRNGYQKVHAALLQTTKSRLSAPYRFRKSHFIQQAHPSNHN